MKALSIRQPWAWLIANGHKNIENRRRPTKFRGEFLIHASKKVEVDMFYYPTTFFHGIVIPYIDQVNSGGIIGRAKLVDCVQESDSPWYDGRPWYGWVIEDAEPITFRRYRGALGFFEVGS